MKKENYGYVECTKCKKSTPSNRLFWHITEPPLLELRLGISKTQTLLVCDKCLKQLEGPEALDSEELDLEELETMDLEDQLETILK